MSQEKTAEELANEKQNQKQNPCVLWHLQRNFCLLNLDFSIYLILTFEAQFENKDLSQNL